MTEAIASQSLPAARPLRVLLVENDRPDAELTIHALVQCSYDIKWDVVETLPEFERMVASESIDLVIADYRLPGWTGMDALEALQRLRKDIPLILVTGTLGEDAAVECIKRGVSDYVLKGRLSRLPHAVQRALEERTLRRERRDAIESLQAREASFRLLFAGNPQPMWVYDDETLRFLEVNDAAVLSYGYSRDEFLQMRMTEIHPQEDVPCFLKYVREVPSVPQNAGQWRHRLKDGDIIDVEVVSHGLDFDCRRAVLVVAQDITERKRAEEALRTSQDRLRRLVESSPVGIIMADVHGRISEANHAFLAIAGYTREDFTTGKINWQELSPPEYRHLNEQAIRQLQEVGATASSEREFKRKDGSRVPVMVGASLLEGSSEHFVAFVLDLTERKGLEEQLRQALKMQAVGQLAGGIAHDFNNLLGVIIGYADLLRDKLNADDQLLKFATEIKKAGDSAARLTRQLLAFSRQQVLQLKVLDLNDAVVDSEKLLHRLIGENIELIVNRGVGSARVKADPGQLEQILMNLAVNARDAMPQGGKLSISTANFELDAGFARLHDSLTQGPYVMLAVSDTGIGMDAATQARIFEPFFTTKERGKGTGLGMSTVYGIVKQCGGHISVHSEPGLGTTFKVYFPLVEGTPDAEPASNADMGSIPRGKETILLIEDADSLRRLTREYLEASGYVVLEAQNGIDALEISANLRDPLHMVITDVIMPKINGRELAERLERARPELKVLYMSGYPDEIISHHGVLNHGVNFVQKPFSPREFLCKVRETLDAANTNRSMQIALDATEARRGP